MRKMKAVLYPKDRKELKVGNVTFRSFYDNRVTEDDLKQAHLELGETEETKTATLQKLKDALISDKDFHYRLDDEYLLRFLRYRKYDVKKAYTTVRKFYEDRKERPDLFVIPSNLDFFLRRDILKCLPYRTEEGNLIFWIDTSKWNVDEMSFADIIIMAHAYSDVISMNPNMQINQLIGLWDIGGLTASHLFQYAKPSYLRNFLKTMQSHYPWRIKRIIAFNCNAVIRGVFNAFRYLLSKKVADRIILLGYDISEVHQYVNTQLLPKVYGGSIEEHECSIVQYIEDNLPYIEYERSFGANTED